MNTMLIDSYIEYDKYKTITILEEFTKKTFPSNGTDKLFIGCVLILFDYVYKTKVSAETLRSVVLAGKKKIKDTNMLIFYYERINRNKLVSKYLKKVLYDINFDNYLDLILEYIDEMSFDFIKYIEKFNQDKINDYINK